MRFGITMQREFSLLDGKERERPLDPIRKQPALVQIGNQRVMARVDIAPQPTPDEQESGQRAFVRNWAKRQNHECAQTAMGEWCGHNV